MPTSLVSTRRKAAINAHSNCWSSATALCYESEPSECLRRHSEFTPSHAVVLDSVMELVPTLFQRRRCAPLDLVTKRHVAERARKDHQGEQQGDEWWHSANPFGRIPPQSRSPVGRWKCEAL